MATNSSFYTDGETYDTAVVTSNDTPGSTTPSQAPSSFYPEGNVYDALAEESTTVASMEALVAQAQASATAAAHSDTDAAAHDTSATAHDASAAIHDTNASNSATAAAASAASAASHDTSATAHDASAATHDTNAATSAAAALASQNAAASSETNAASSASSAYTNATSAQGSAAAAAASQTNAHTSETNAATSAASAASAATTAVTTAVTNLVGQAPTTLNTLNELATALGDDPNFATTMTATLATKAPLASPALTGTPTAPTPAAGTNSTQIATTAFVSSSMGPYATTASLASYAPLASPAFTGAISLNGQGFATTNGSYNVLYDGAGNAALFLGFAGDPENYYRNGGHVFGSIAGAVTYATLNAGGLSLNVPFSTTAAASFPPIAIAYAASITWPLNAAQKAKVTLSGNPGMYVSGAVEGTTYFLWLIQDATGSRAVSWSSSFDFGASGAPTLSTTPYSADLICFEAVSLNGTLKLRFCGIQKGFS